MNSLNIFDALDHAIGRLLANPDATTADLRSGIAELVDIVPDLRQLPSMEFKTRLMVELLWQASGRAISTVPPPIRAARDPQSDPDLLPTFASKTIPLYPIQRSSVAASVALHAAMLLLIGLGFVMVKSTARMDDQQVAGATRIDGLVLPAGSGPKRGGGGAGSADNTGASKGAAPRFTKQQFSSPTVELEDHARKLPVEATLIGPPELRLPQTQTGDPLSNLVTLSNGAGVSGIGGGRGKYGDGPGSGGGNGPGSGGGCCGDFYLAGKGVTAPRAIYSPEPEFSDEARRVKFQGVVVLLAIIGPDGRPRNLHVARSLGMGLDEKAIEAVRTWRFEPGMKDGHPVAIQIAVEVDFHLF
ncbi:MAG TPA: energy transducer TonB [Candidatus Angelobacter sp.]|nr:energy transducer TonB [Candidatus Angelobacter sp.]